MVNLGKKKNVCFQHKTLITKGMKYIQEKFLNKGVYFLKQAIQFSINSIDNTP
jgi:hypothetical protein